MNKKFISPSNMPPTLPVTAAMAWWLFLEYVGAPLWLQILILSLQTLCFISQVKRMATETPVDIFKEGR
jgi:hypothetical protein